MSSTSIVVPCYNEEKRLNGEAFLSFLSKHKEVSILFVDDGSSDKTFEVLKRLQNQNSEQVLLHQMPQNSGKAEAVRVGILKAFESDFKLIGFWDADLSAPLDQIPFLIEKFRLFNSIKMVIGSRIKRFGAEIERNPLRHYLGRVFSTFSSVILKLPVYDSQCGAKLFHRDVIHPLFEKPFITKWLFDVEFLIRYRNHFGVSKTLEQIEEVPLNKWKEVGGSKLKFSDFIKVPVELWNIHKTYNK